MKNIIAIIAGDPESINSELIAKAWKKKYLFKNINIFIIGNFKLINKQLNLLNIKINTEKILDLKQKSFNKNLLVYDVPIAFKKPFKINLNSKRKYVLGCLKKGIELAKQKKIWKKEREYERFMDTLTDEEKATLSPDEIKLKLSQIHTWREDPNDKYKNNV